MIQTKEQEELFRLIVNYLETDVLCIAIGGTAMMFAGYKNATKDIDLVFKTEKDRDFFIHAIKQLGYTQKTLFDVYDEKRRLHTGKPVMYSRGDERFDLFVKNVFGFEISFDISGITQRHDFIDKSELIVYTLPEEQLILLKAITGREKDYEDIESIIAKKKEIDWNLIVQSASNQRSSNSWILIDLEETLQKLRKKVFLKQEIFDAIYNAQDKNL